MTADATSQSLTLTTYFGERVRSGDRFLADALLDLFAANAVPTSVVLRGAASFGPQHTIRSDQTLSMSEDPPIAVTAIDAVDRMTTLADQVAALTSRGLITLERTRVLDGTEVSLSGDVKLTIYVGRQDRATGQPAYRSVCAILRRHDFAGAAVFLGVDGTRGAVRRRARFFGRNLGVPVAIAAVGSGGRVAAAVAELRAILVDPVMTVEHAQVCKRDGTVLSRPAAPQGADRQPIWQKLTVHTSEATLYQGSPVHQVLLRRLREERAATGATVLRGVWGFHGDHEPHGDRFFQLARQVPITTVVVDSPQRIAKTFDVIDQVTDRRGLVTSEVVPALVSIDGGERRGDLSLT